VALVDTSSGAIVGRSLDECEEVIERGLASFVEVGEALAEVRDSRLYRESHETFEAYCSERWGLSRSRSYELIDAAHLTSALSGIPDTPLPANAGQAAALRPVRGDHEAAARAMRDAHDATDGKPTAEVIADEVEKQLATKAAAAAKRAEDKAALEDLANEVNPPDFDPTKNAEMVRQRGEFARLCRDLSKLPPAAEFLKKQGGELRERHFGYAEAAFLWLDEFLHGKGAE
jgi:hypothetical protein